MRQITHHDSVHHPQHGWGTVIALGQDPWGGIATVTFDNGLVATVETASLTHQADYGKSRRMDFGGEGYVGGPTNG